MSNCNFLKLIIVLLLFIAQAFLLFGCDKPKENNSKSHCVIEVITGQQQLMLIPDANGVLQQFWYSTYELIDTCEHRR